MSFEKHTNRLITESSPYLQQHAHNPVDWYPWCDEAFEKAKKENKLVLVSIGYSACHWCHVMEHESFENEDVAAVMNKFFVNIKVDREERPDIDQIYMSAVQLMSGQGGWPLNCFVLPDGRPVYGGTYFKTEQWINVLHQLRSLFDEEKEKVISYAEKLTNGIKDEETSLSIGMNPDEFSSYNPFPEMMEKWQNRFDNIEGGPNKSPKFMLPNNYQFLMHYAFINKDEKIKKHVELTLDKMAMGGIYDQIGGGFARYSTDMVWKVPHFEKMLYDNAQLISLYSQGYRWFKKDLYKETVYQTIEFIKRELTGKDALSDLSTSFYSALDADSEGEEGKYYVWTKEELKTILGNDYDLICDYYDLNGIAHWEHGNHILLRRMSDEEFSRKKSISVNKLKAKVNSINKKLLTVREERIKPGLDNKTLTSWNAMMIKGLCDAYQTFDEKSFLELAEKNIHFILSQQLKSDGTIHHAFHNGKSYINGFLEDYAFLIEALIALYESTGKELYYQYSIQFTELVLEKFFDREKNIFYFNSIDDPQLIARKSEIHDNVIPASASVMVKNLFLLSRISEKTEWEALAEKCLSNILPVMENYGPAFSNWAITLLYLRNPFYEVAITGEAAQKSSQEIQKEYHPQRIVCFSETESQLPLLVSRLKTQQTLIYICQNKSCNLPVETLEEAFALLK